MLLRRGLRFDVVVVGGGHAGCEAAAAAARSGARTALVTQRLSSVGELSCNPAMGGIGKGHLIREVDALGGLIGVCSDASAIHYKLLNRRKGPAVRGPRAQTDRDLYRATMRGLLEAYDSECAHSGGSLSLVEASVEDLILGEGREGPSAAGVVTDRGDIHADAVVLTTGTFLRGRVHIGRHSRPAGRYNRADEDVEPPATRLARRLGDLGFPLSRLKTGTPPRLDAHSIDYSACEREESELPPALTPLSFLTDASAVPNMDRLVPCHKTWTNEATHRIVAAHAADLPAYSGPGPRYCPSLAAKVERFADRPRHLVWLEPEGLPGAGGDLVYPQGLSGAFPEEVQLRVLHSIRGLEQVKMVRPGYDVEYDFVCPRDLRHSLQSRRLEGLFLAGQVNGTTGYEEAAAQGIVAGANAAKVSVGSPGLSLSRSDGYIGVLIDDLVTRGATEPYRMFTSRAEWRIALRCDNADLRLTPIALDSALLGPQTPRAALFAARRAEVEGAVALLGSLRAEAGSWAAFAPEGRLRDAWRGKRGARTLRQALTVPRVELWEAEATLRRAAERRLEGDAGALRILGDREGLERWRVADGARESVEAECHYDAYLEQIRREMESWERRRARALPEDLDYRLVPSLSAEQVERLEATRPRTFAEAEALEGVTPAALMALWSFTTAKAKGDGRARAGAGGGAGAGARGGAPAR